MEANGIYILGAGSIGMALAVHLARAGRHVTALRTSAGDVERQTVEISVSGSDGRTFTAPVEMMSLAKLQGQRLAGIVAVTAKTYANAAIAARLAEMDIAAPVVIMQNGVGVEDGYLAIDGLHVYRCVLYATAQQAGENRYTFAPVTASQIGVVRGDEAELARTVDVLNTSEFPFTASGNIQQAVWKKAAANAVFNSVCPLLEVDNGIFVRDDGAARLAREIVDECVAVMDALGLGVGAEEVMQQILVISGRSSGQLISTLQDINAGRDTEIDDLNLAIARIASRVAPDAKVTSLSSLPGSLSGSRWHPRLPVRRPRGGAWHGEACVAENRRAALRDATLVRAGPQAGRRPGSAELRRGHSPDGRLDGRARGRVAGRRVRAGTWGRRRASRAMEVYGIDISWSMLRQGMRMAGARRVDAMHFAHARVEALPFHDGQFDAAYCGGALHGFPDTVGALREIGRALKPGAPLVVLTFLNRDQQLLRMRRRAEARDDQLLKVHMFEVPELEHALCVAGFEDFEPHIYGGVIIFRARRAD